MKDVPITVLEAATKVATNKNSTSVVETYFKMLALVVPTCLAIVSFTGLLEKKENGEISADLSNFAKIKAAFGKHGSNVANGTENVIDGEAKEISE